MKSQTKVKGQDRVDRLRSKLRKFPHAYVQIGFFQGAGKYPGEDAPEVVEVALWNEYGTSNMPARPFLGPAVDEHIDLINRWREEMITNIIEKDWEIQKALEAIGFRIKTLIENKIKSNVPPPNAPGTIAHKQSQGQLPKKVKGQGGAEGRAALAAGGKTNTLIDTGLMLRSVTYKVNLGG